MKKIFTVMDAAREEIFIAAASWGKNGLPVIEGFHRAVLASSSFGVYPEPERIRAALSAFTQKTGIPVHDVYAGVSSPSVSVVSSSGSVLISKYGSKISARDIKKCVKIAALARIPLDREVLHKVVMGFSVDGESLITDPEGLEAVKLSAEVNIVTVSISFVRNYSKNIARAGYIPAGFVLSPLASSFRMLSDEDKSDKIAFVSTNREKTEVLFFSRGNLENCRIYDKVLSGSDPDGQGIASAEEDNKWFFREVTSLRGWTGVKRVLISGNRAPSEDLLQAAEKELALPVRVAVPFTMPFEDLPEDGAAYVTALGMLDHLARERRNGSGEINPVKKAFNRIIETLDEYF